MTLWYENNPYLSVVAEVENSHAYLTTDSSITNEDDDNMNIPDKEEQKTVRYQENLKIYVITLTKTLRKYGDQYMKLLMKTFSKKRTFFHNIFGPM